MTAKKVFIKTFGCQMNEYDSDKMADVLNAAQGYEPTQNVDEADLILFNTCSVREKAQEKVFSDLGRVKHLKARGVKIGVGGCVASQEGNAIIARAPYVDIVFGPQTLHRLPEMLAERERLDRPQVDISFPEIEKFDHLPPARVEGATAFVSIMEGCSKYCSYCVVPYTRGEEVNRPLDDVLVEIAGLADQGVREVTLLGQNVNAYHGEDGKGGTASLADLLHRLTAIEGLERLRYTTSHPRDMSADLLAAHRDLTKLMPYLHLPFQAGSDHVLAAMNRKHTGAEYLDLVARIRAARPDIALSTDIIVGFPGESEADFEATLDIVRKVGFAQAYSFKYSPRPGTPAATMGGQLPDAVKIERLARLKALLDAQQSSFNAECVGRVLPVLFERQGRRDGQLIGRSPYLQSVHAEAAPGLMGRIIPVEIAGAGPNSLSGVIRAA